MFQEDILPDLWEDNDLVNAIRAGLSHKIDDILAVGQAEVARHGGDGLILVALLVHEDGQDEVGGGQDGLTHGRPHGLTPPVAARSRRQVLFGGKRGGVPKKSGSMCDYTSPSHPCKHIGCCTPAQPACTNLWGDDWRACRCSLGIGTRVGTAR